MVDGRVEPVHGADGEHRRQVFEAPVLLGGIDQLAEACRFQGGARGRADAQFYALFLVDAGQRRQHGGGDVARHQQRFHRVARRVALGLGVVGHADCLVQVRIGVDVDVADTVQVLDHRHAGLFHQARDQALATARHDHVDIFRHRDQPAHGGAVGGLDDLHGLRRQSGRRQPFRHQRGQCRVRLDGLGAPAQDRGVAGLQAQRRGVDGHVRARLVDDADHAQRHAHLTDLNAGRAELHIGDLADRVCQRGNLLQPCRHRDDGLVGQRQAVHERGVLAVGAGTLHIARVHSLELVGIPADGGGDGQQRAVLVSRGGPRHRA
ncbi:hypothetical protein D3C81_975550 [compost metagenome]